MRRMSHDISYNTAEKSQVLVFLGSGGDLSEHRQGRLERIRKAAEAHQLRLDYQDVDWGLSITDALDHLIAGRADSDADCAGNAYRAALQHIIDFNGSDSSHLGTYSRPSTFFGLVDDEMRRLGVPADLLPGGFLYAGPPDEITFHIPHSMDGYPEIGHLPLAKAKPAADAYRAVLDQMDKDLRYDVQILIDKLDFEHTEWESALKHSPEWYKQDTIFFSLT